MERTFVMLKPDGLNRSLVGEVINRFERKGLKLVGCKMFAFTEELVKEHYAHLADKPFFPGIQEYITRTPVVATVWEGKGAVDVVRKLCGVTNSREALPGTIRGDLGMSIQCNVVHASDSIETAEIEVKRFFKPEELYDWNKDVSNVYSGDEL